MLHLLIKTLANIEGFFRKKSLAFGKCFSKSYGYFTAFFFDNEKRMDVFEEFQHFRALNFPDILLFPIWIGFTTRGVHFVETTSKIFKKPNHKAFICSRNVYTKIKLATSRWVNLTLPQHDTSFPINNTCKISQFFPMIHGVHNV